MRKDNAAMDQDVQNILEKLEAKMRALFVHYRPLDQPTCQKFSFPIFATNTAGACAHSGAGIESS